MENKNGDDSRYIHHHSSDVTTWGHYNSCRSLDWLKVKVTGTPRLFWMELRQHIKRQKVFADSTQTLFQGVRRHPAAAPTLPKLEVKTPKASLSGEDNVFPQISLSSWNDFKTWYLFGIHCSFANMGFVHTFVVFMWVVWDYWIVWDCWGSMVVWVSCIRGFILPMDYLYVYIYIYIQVYEAARPLIWNQ